MAPRALSDAAWIAIDAAAKAAKLSPDAEARTELARVLFEEYPAFAYDRERVAAALRQSERMLKRLNAFAEAYWWTWLPDLPSDQFRAILAGRADAFIPGNVKTERDLWCMKMLRRRPEATWHACRAIGRANRRRRNPQREFLISRLCGIWLNNFGAQYLTVTVPALGGEPRGPLIEFLLAALREIMPRRELPDRETLRDLIDREREGRDNVRQLRLQLVQR
jgi:hypothetical protein